MKKTAPKSISNNSKSKKMKSTKATALTEKKSFSYERKSMPTASLSSHPAVLALGNCQPNEIFMEFLKEFGYLETPVVTEDGYVITHMTDVIAAQQLNIKTIDVVVMKNATQDDVVRFISFKDAVKHGKNKTALFNSVKFLTSYLTTTQAGKEWAGEFESNKTRSVVAEILGVSTGTVQNVSAIGKAEPLLLEQIDNNELTSTAAIKKVTNVVPFVSRKVYDGLVFSNTGIKNKPKLNINSLTINIEELGSLDLLVNDTDVNGSLNGLPLEKMSHRVESDYDSKDSGKSQHVQTHTFIPINDRYSIQVIIRDLDQLGDVKELAIAA